ncbi:promotilin [Tachyglossus aculeatus]|uniref:promotilin n=1 Tax=Tachyglossus aculeatus TaxID=9261 RepID=UPI0018F489B7|nr:promotilin [Tachyglossus aculeatus]
MVSRRAVAFLLVVYVAAMMAEGFVPIFTHSDVQRMQERERNKGQKKSLTVQKRLDQGGLRTLAEPHGEEEDEIVQLAAPVGIGLRMNSRQLAKYRGILEELIVEALLSTQNEMPSQAVSLRETQLSLGYGSGGDHFALKLQMS